MSAPIITSPPDGQTVLDTVPYFKVPFNFSCDVPLKSIAINFRGPAETWGLEPRLYAGQKMYTATPYVFPLYYGDGDYNFDVVAVATDGTSTHKSLILHVVTPSTSGVVE